MGVIYYKLSVKKDTKELMLKCIDEYRQHHPELDEIPISQNKILYEVFRYYLER